MSRLRTFRAFIAPKLHRVVEFLSFQGITTAGNLLYGFLCVRLLPVGGYAKFAVVFGLLSSVALLMDIGISNTLAPLVGERIGNLQLIADYLASLRQVAHRLFMVVAPVTAIVFPFLVHKQPWNGTTVASMAAIILFGAWFARVSAAYGAVLILRRDRKRWYMAQMHSSLGTLALLLLFWSFHQLHEFTAILINVAGIVYVSQAYFFRARHLLKTHGHPSKTMRREIVQLAAPNATSTFFYAIQGQISLFLITLFGHTMAVASIGALTRLSQIFVLLSQMNPLLIEPYFARLPRNRLKTSYLIAIAAAAGFSACCVVVAWIFPELFLWILGPKYSQLHHEVLLVITARSISFICGIMWTIHSARKFVYWWTNMALIAATLIIQVLFIWKVDLSTVSAVLMMGITTAVASQIVHFASGIYGFKRGPRQFQPFDSEISPQEATHA